MLLSITLVVIVLLLGCEAPTGPEEQPGPEGYVSAVINGSLWRSEYARGGLMKEEGSATVSARLNDGAPPSRYGVSLALNVPQPVLGRYLVELLPRQTSLLISEGGEDVIYTTHQATSSGAAEIVIESYESKSRWITGRFHGTFVVEPFYSAIDHLRRLPDTLRIENGYFEARLIPYSGY